MFGKLHLTLNLCVRPIANKHCEGKMLRTSKREMKVLQIVGREVNMTNVAWEDWRTTLALHVGVSAFVSCSSGTVHLFVELSAFVALTFRACSRFRRLTRGLRFIAKLLSWRADPVLRFFTFLSDRMVSFDSS